MLAELRPQLRPYVIPAQDHADPAHVYLVDRLGLNGAPQRLTMQEFFWLRLFDGRRTLREVQVEAVRQAGGCLFPLERFVGLAEKLDEALLLDGPKYQQAINSSVRPPRCIGCYEGEPAALRHQLEGLFTGPGGSGLPRHAQPDDRLRAALLPHIDYARGGAAYTWAFKEVVEHSDASLFVIIGTSHYSGHRFTLTRKDFATPLGIVRTDQDYIDRLVKHYGPGLFDDELLAHLPEHSIELEVVLLQYLYEGRRPIRIVPLVVGSFQDCVEQRTDPLSRPDIDRMVQALKQAEAETGEPICYLISGDLAHIGPKFGDPGPVDETLLRHSRSQDQAILEQLEIPAPGRYFRVIAEEGDARRICGLPPTYLVLEAARPSRARVLRYQQYVHPGGFESVSFASAAFYR